MLTRVAELRRQGRIRIPVVSACLWKARKPARTGGSTCRHSDLRPLPGPPVPASEVSRSPQRAIMAEPTWLPRPPTAQRCSWSALPGSDMTGLIPPGPLKVHLVAGEESGDRLGAALMRALKQRHDARSGLPVSVDRTWPGGVRSPFAIDELSIIGFAAVPRRLPSILRRIRETAHAVVAARPDALVIIDSPDFTHRVARRVRAFAPSIPIVDYVSPSVWAWRSGRARAMRSYIDHVLAILPFEPAAHQQLGGPPCTYVGHPLAERVGGAAAE